MLKKIVCTLVLISSFCFSCANAENALSSLLNTAKEQSSLQVEPPFLAKCEADVNTPEVINCSIQISDNAFVYKDSIKVATQQGIINIESLPEGIIHKDLNGTSEIYKTLALVKVNLINVKQGETLTLTYQGCDSNGICFPPISYEYSVEKTVSTNIDSQNNSSNALFKQTDNFIIILLLCLVFGAALDLTPCVLPMLSIYSATILGSKYVDAVGKLKQNLSYIAGLSLTYCVLGLVFAQIGVAAHSVLQHPISIIIMAVLLLVFALDCAGIIKIKIPMLFNNSLQIAINKQKEGTLAKAFVFGSLSALITTPCTSAPLAGALVYIMTSNSIAKGVLMFLAIGLGMGLPLLLIGTYGSKFLSKFKNHVNQIRHLFAIPLLLGAYYICRHLFGAANIYIEPIIYALCISYFLGVMLKNKKIASIMMVSLLSFAVVFSLFNNEDHNNKALPHFTKLIEFDSLEKFHGTPTLITVSADWCTNCHELDDSLYSSKEFLELTKDIDRVRFDFTNPNSKRNIKLAKKLNIIGVPFMAVLNKKGQLVGSYTGLIEIEKLKEILDKAK